MHLKYRKLEYIPMARCPHTSSRPGWTPPQTRRPPSRWAPPPPRSSPGGTSWPRWWTDWPSSSTSSSSWSSWEPTLASQQPTWAEECYRRMKRKAIIGCVYTFEDLLKLPRSNELAVKKSSFCERSQFPNT